MESRYVREFIVLAKCMSFSVAASELFTTQASLSKHIQTLERELGEQLFIRTTRHIELSPFGRFWLPHAERITEAVEGSESEIIKYKQSIDKSCTLASVRNIQFYGIDKVIMGFYERYPEDFVYIYEAEENDIRAMFRDHKVNLITDYFPSSNLPEGGFYPVKENHIIAAVSVHHPLSAYDSISLEMLKHENILLPARNTRMHKMVTDAYDAAGLELPRRIIYEGNSGGHFSFVSAGKGISLNAKDLVSPTNQEGIKCVSIYPDITYRYGLAFHPESELSLPEKHLVSYVKSLSQYLGFI